MAVCDYCGEEQKDADSCIRRYNRQIRLGSEENFTASDRCPFCGVAVNGLHHPDCEIEECPECHELLVLTQVQPPILELGATYQP